MRYIWVLLLLSVMSCKTTEKKAKAYYLENKGQLSELCKDCFPVREVTLKGDTVTVVDTVTTLGDTIFVDCPDGTKVECPPAKKITVTKTNTVTDTIIRVDSALVYYYRHLANMNEKELVKEQGKRNKEKDRADKYWSWLMYILGGVGIVGLVVVMKSKLKV